MAREDIMQIKVNRHSVGIMGLKAAMADMAEEYAEGPDDEVGSELLKHLSRKNYIPDRLKPEYAKAFLREFKKSLGKSVMGTPVLIINGEVKSVGRVPAKTKIKEWLSEFV